VGWGGSMVREPSQLDGAGEVTNREGAVVAQPQERQRRLEEAEGVQRFMRRVGGLGAV
jgi:hypothetical protein